MTIYPHREEVADVVKRMEAILERVENERDTALGVLEALLKHPDNVTARDRARALVEGRS